MDGGPSVIIGDEVAQARLPQVRFARGYDPSDVDALLDRAAAALRSWEGGAAPDLRAADLSGGEARFGSVRFRSGYDADAVDDLIDRIAQQLRVYEQAARLP